MRNGGGNVGGETVGEGELDRMRGLRELCALLTHPGDERMDAKVDARKEGECAIVACGDECDKDGILEGVVLEEGAAGVADAGVAATGEEIACAELTGGI